MKITKPYFGRSYFTTDYDYIPLFTLIPTLQVDHLKDSKYYGFALSFLFWNITWGIIKKTGHDND